jgi:hypothetical protein
MSVYARASQLLIQSKSTNSDGIVVTTYSDDIIVRGSGHTLANSATLTGSTTINFLVDMSSVDNDKTVFILPCLISSESHRVQFKFYEDTDYSGGTPVATFNPNRLSSNTKQTVFTTGASGTDKGDLLVTRNAFAANKDSAESSAYSFLILDKTKKYLAEFENTSANDTVIDYSTTLFEV